MSTMHKGLRGALTNAVVCWNTVYLEAAIEHFRSNGSHLDDDTTRQLRPRHTMTT